MVFRFDPDLLRCLMRVPLAWIKWMGVLLCLILVVWLYLLWQPERQVERHTLNLLERTSARNWPKVTVMMSADYRDRWGHDRATAINNARELFSHFFALHLVPMGPLDVSLDGQEASSTAPLEIFGSGTALAHAVMAKLRELEKPFVFRWQKNGIWPWQWVLVGVDQEELFPGRTFPRD